MADKSAWDPAGSKDPDVGTTANGAVVSFKTGAVGGPKEGHTLIADGIKDAKAFDAHHDHSGPGFYRGEGAYTGAGGSNTGRQK